MKFPLCVGVLVSMAMAIAMPGAFGQGQTGWSTQFDAASNVVLLSFGDPFVYDPQMRTATLADGSVVLDLSHLTIVSGEGTSTIRADVIAAGMYGGNSYGNLELKNFTDQNGASVSLNDFQEGVRHYLVILRGKTNGQLYTVNLSVQPKGMAILTASTTNERNQIVLLVTNADAAALFQALSAQISAIKIEYDFGADSMVSNIVTGVARIDPPPVGGNAITLYPKAPLPYAAKPYKANITLPKAMLPKNIAAPPGSGYKVSAAANYPSPAVVETAATYDFEPSFTSAVNKSKDTRTNTGLFIVTLNPVLFLHEIGTGGSASHTGWVDFRPNISANVDTLPEKSSTTPNRITIALDTEAGLTTGAAQTVGQPFQWTWTNGIRTDTDRDFKIFSTYWHTDLAPDLWKFSESQAFRTQKLNALGKTTSQLRSPFVTAYRMRPSVGFDLGETTVRSGTFNPELGTSVSRFLFKMDTMLEIRGKVTFTAVDTGYYLFDASRRNARDFLDAQVAVNTGLLLRLDTSKIQSAVTFRYQRGSQPPSFTPVDTLSLGLKLYR
jgi:hypothetical protein